MARKLWLLVVISLCVAQVASAGLITSVVRQNGTSGNRAWIGAFDGSTTPEVRTLADGEMVFMDRTYPWSGTPSELVGAEYVLTFNTDKSSSETDVSYTVTLGQAAILAVTIDDRIPASWNGGGAITSQQDAADMLTAAFAPAGTFLDTGYNLYVHESSTMDRPMSVFAANMPAGTYTFAAMPSNQNFYTIGAVVPEPATLALLGLGGLVLRRRK